jgi:hypothetical protein
MKKLNKFLKSKYGYFLAIMFYFCIGCTISQFKIHDDYFNQYIDLFTKLSNGKINNYDILGLTVRFKKLNNPTIGRCFIGYKHIDIDPKFWYNNYGKRKIALFLHEAAHCICLSEHINGNLKDGCPKSIMSPYILSNYCLNKHWDFYIKELFKDC